MSTRPETSRKQSSPWAGDRQVLLSDHAVGLPSTCGDFEPDERAESESETETDYGEDDNPLYTIKTQVQMPLSVEKLFRGRYYLGGAELPFMPIFSSEDHLLFGRLMAMLRCGTKRAGVLRNLSKRQYVLLDTKLAESDYAYSLGEAVIIRSQWTNDQYGVCGNSEWAGDRFDIRTADDVTEEWTDKSDETVDLLRVGTEMKAFNGLRSWVQ